MALRGLVLLAAFFPLLVLDPALGVPPERVLVVVNAESAQSIAIASYYAQRREIPLANICLLPIETPTSETITREQYWTFIRDPIRDHLTRHNLFDTILYIVTTKGVPLRVAEYNTSNDDPQDPSTFDRSSVDSDLCLVKESHTYGGFIYNPYLGQRIPFEEFEADPWQPEVVLVVRLTGYELDEDLDGLPDDVKALIDRAQCPVPWGKFLLDTDPTKSGGYQVGNQWMIDAAAQLDWAGFNVQLDLTTEFVGSAGQLLGYSSWGSNDSNAPPPPYYSEEVPGVFVPGSLACTIVSTNGRTFTYGPSGPNYGQSLVADLIALGVTGAQGHVYEPFIGGVARPDVLYPRYVVDELDLAESFYAATRYVSWQEVVVGDPLMQQGDTQAWSSSDLFLAGWNLVAIPVALDSMAPEDVFADLAPGNSIEGNLFRWAPERWGWVVYPDPDFGDISTGVAYWLCLEVDNGALRLPGDPNPSPVEISFTAPMTVLGSPYELPVKWSDCLVYQPQTEEWKTVPEAILSGWLGPCIRTWNAQQGRYASIYPCEDEEAVLLPWHGYLLQTPLSSLSLIVPRPGDTSWNNGGEPPDVPDPPDPPEPTVE